MNTICTLCGLVEQDSNAHMSSLRSIEPLQQLFVDCSNTCQQHGTVPSVAFRAQSQPDLHQACFGHVLLKCVDSDTSLPWTVTIKLHMIADSL